MCSVCRAAQPQPPSLSSMAVAQLRKGLLIKDSTYNSSVEAGGEVGAAWKGTDITIPQEERNTASFFASLLRESEVVGVRSR